MQIDIHFRDLGRTEALENFLMEKIGNNIESFLKNDGDSRATVRVEQERHRTLNRKPSFHCEVILKPTHQKGTIKVSKTGEDFYTVINDTATALRTILRRLSSRKIKKGRERTRDLSIKDSDLVA